MQNFKQQTAENSFFKCHILHVLTNAFKLSDCLMDKQSAD